MNKYEYAALGEHLSDWPETMTYRQVIKALLADSEDISICDFYECVWPETLAEKIESFKCWLELNFIAK